MKFKDLPPEVRAFLETESFQERFCKGCFDEDDCPCGMVQGSEHCFRREIWDGVVEVLVEVSDMIGRELG